MSGTLTFFIALLGAGVVGAGVGGFLALLLYSLCVVAGDADDYREAYRAGWQAAMAKREES